MDFFFRNYYLATNYVPTDMYPILYGEEQCKPGYSFGPCVRSNYIIHYVYSGCGILRVGKDEYKIGKGEMFLIKPNSLAYYRADLENPWLYRWIEFNGSMSERILAPFKSPVLRDFDSKQIGQRLKDFVGSGQISFENAMERFWGILAALNERPSGGAPINTHEYVLMAEQYIKNNINKKITVNDIAAHIGINRSYLSRLFKERNGVSPQQYLTTAKINAAAQYLKNTDISVTGAAQSVGYTDYRVFNKVFRRHFNASPSEWRNKHIWQQSIIETK